MISRPKFSILNIFFSIMLSGIKLNAQQIQGAMICRVLPLWVLLLFYGAANGQIPKFCKTTSVTVPFKNRGMQIPYKRKMGTDSIFVDSATGSDINGTGTKNNPVKTIQKGIDYAYNGYAVIVGNGTYTGSGNTNINPNGKAIIIQSSNGPGFTQINGENTYRGFILNTGESSTTIIRGFTIRNCVPPSSTPTWTNIDGHGGAIFCDENSGVFVEFCYFFNCSRVIDLGNREQSTTNSTTIRNCVFEANQKSCISGDKVSFYFDSCIFQHNTVNEIHGKGHVFNPPGSASFNIFRNNYSPTGIISATGHGFIISNSIYYDNKSHLGTVYHGTSWTGNPAVDHCTFYNNCPNQYTSGWYDHIGTTKNSIFSGFNTKILDHISGTQNSITFKYNNCSDLTGNGNFSGSPGFKDTGIYDFSLISGSINIGTDENGNNVGADFNSFPNWMIAFPYLDTTNNSQNSSSNIAITTWSGNGTLTKNRNNFSTGAVPFDSLRLNSGILTIDSAITIGKVYLNNGSSIKLEKNLTINELYLKNGTIDLNGHKLTITGRIYQSTDSTNYYIQAGTSATPKPRSELAIKTSTAANSTLYFNPSANRLNKLEIGNGTTASQITLANAVKIKGGEDGGTGPGLLTVNKNAKIIIANGASLTLESDTFNAGLSLAQPAQRSIVCQGTGKFNIERDHFGARGWRLYSHPFKADIDLQEVANDIELIGPGGTAEGFYSNTNTNASAYWYDYSKADSSAASDPAWTAFTSAKGSSISENANKWTKNSPMLLFNPGNRRGTDAFGSPTTATYEQGKISLSYTLDSTTVHLNDGTTQTVTATNIPSYVPTNGLVGYWPFNGNANDESGNGYNGTVNGASPTMDRNGYNNRAYDFDGNDYIDLGRLESIDTLNANKDVTISVWFKAVVNQSSLSMMPLLSKRQTYWGSAGFTESYFSLHGGGSNFNNKAYAWGDMHFYYKGWDSVILGEKTDDDKWHHILIKKDLNIYSMYFDGLKSGSFIDNSTFHSIKNMIVGYQGVWGFNSERWFHGKIDDIAIWNRALSSSEISAFYNASTNTNISAKSRYFFITNPFTTPVKLCRIQGLNATNVDPSFYYWKQRRNTVTNNFSPAEWQAERIFNGTALRDSNIAIPAFGTILVRLKNNNTTFTIPESSKQLSNFDYIIGGAKGTSKTGLMFLDASASDVGNNGLEIKLLVNDSQEADRVLVYNEPMQSAQFTTADARKYLNSDFPNVFTLSSDAKPLALDMQDIKAELENGKLEVAIPLAVNREANKRFPTLKWEITANTTGFDVYLRNRENGSTELWSVGDIKTVSFKSDASEIRNYELVFKRNSSSTEDLTQKPSLSKRAPMELIIYPNPVEDKLHLKVINASGGIPFHIYSITGVKVLEGSLKSEKTINTAGLNAGVYVIDAGGLKVKFIKK
jgi:hypothetical protein